MNSEKKNPDILYISFSRSPAIVIGYLMRTYNVSLEQCLIHVVKSRPCIIPNDGFLKQLILFDRFLVEQRQQQKAPIIQAVNTATTTEIPIQRRSPVAPQSEPSSVPVVLTTPECSDISVSNTSNILSVDSSNTELSSTSNTPSSKTNSSVQIIPIQIPSKESIPEKVN